VKIEMSIHRRCERIPPSISSPWASSSVVGREQLIRIELTFASGLVKKAVPRLNATFFKSAAWYAASMSMVEGTSTQSKNPPSGIQTMVPPGNNFQSVPWRFHGVAGSTLSDRSSASQDPYFAKIFERPLRTAWLNAYPAGISAGQIGPCCLLGCTLRRGYQGPQFSKSS
jgi:hypothetical protein